VHQLFVSNYPHIYLHFQLILFQGLFAFVVAGTVSGIYGMMKIDKDKQITNVLAEERKKHDVGSPEFLALTEGIIDSQMIRLGGDMAEQAKHISGGYDFGKEDEYGIVFDSILGQLKGTLAGGTEGEMEIAVDIVTNLVDNASVTLEQKMETLGMVGGESGWTSDATISMIARMIDKGIPWGTINNTLEQYGVADDEVMKEIIGLYTDEGMSLEDLQFMLQEAGVPESLLRTINATVDEVVADRSSFNNFTMRYDGPAYIEARVTPRQHGGPVYPNEVYQVGEVGPEFFVPSTPGRIYSHSESSQMANRMGGGSTGPVHIHVEVGGHEFAAYVSNVSDNVRVKAERAIEAGQPRTRRL